ncbi:FMN-linked oxidoreductase, partial [Auricularia subglabra TFB-10046 SS5]
ILGEPVRLPFSGKTAPNRFWKCGMTERLSTFSDSDEMERGRPTSSYQRLYSVFGNSGTGVLVTGNIMVQRSYLEAKGNAIISHDLPGNNSPFHDVARAAKRGGSLILGQLCDPGYQPNPPTLARRICVSPAATRSGAVPVDLPPSPLTLEEIKAIVHAFAHAAKVLHDAGFDGVQLHAAYGHLITQFLSPASNKREDIYGGSPENRTRFLFEIIAAIRGAVSDDGFIVSLKVNSLDFIKCGYPDEDARILAEKLEHWRVDVIEISGGAYEFPSALKQASLRERHAKFEGFARAISQHLTTTLVVINGGLRTAARMADVVRSGMGNFVGLARVLCAEPELPTEILSGKTNGAKD